jgi:hypothetical protein
MFIIRSINLTWWAVTCLKQTSEDYEKNHGDAVASYTFC